MTNYDAPIGAPDFADSPGRNHWSDMFPNGRDIFYEGNTGNEFLGNPVLVSHSSRSFPCFLSLDRETSARESKLERARAQQGEPGSEAGLLRERPDQPDQGDLRRKGTLS